MSSRIHRCLISAFAMSSIGLTGPRAVLAAPTAQVISNLTVTSVADVDYNGEIVEITVSQPVVAGCTSATAYIVRDANILRGSLALAATALIAGNSISIFVTGACDSAGEPLISSVVLNR